MVTGQLSYVCTFQLPGASLPFTYVSLPRLWSGWPCCGAAGRAVVLALAVLSTTHVVSTADYRSAFCIFRKPVLVMSRAVRDDSFVRRGSGPQCPKMCWLHHDGILCFGTQHVLLLEASVGEYCLLLRLLWGHHLVHHLWNVQLC